MNVNEAKRQSTLADFEDGRTDLVFTLLENGITASFCFKGISLLQTCAYYGDVSAIRYLLSKGASIDSLGSDLGLTTAAFHGHWRLCKFLLEHGANVNGIGDGPRETPLHATLCDTDRLVFDQVLKVLLEYGADPNIATASGAETGGFMRDSRTKGETALHRAAAFGEAGTIQLLLNAGAQIDARDAQGDTPLSWASWYLRPANILHQLCYGDFHVNPGRNTMRANLIGFPRTAD